MSSVPRAESQRSLETRLRDLPFFDGLSRRTLRRLAEASHTKFYPKGSTVVRAGEPCRALYFILSGRCKARRQTDEERRFKTTLLVGGDVFGEREWLTGDPFPVEVQVSTDAEILTIPTLELGTVIRKNPVLLHRIAPRLIATSIEHEEPPDGLANAAVGRIATLLFGEEVATDMPMSAVASQIAGKTATATAADTLHLTLRQEAEDTVSSWLDARLSETRDTPASELPAVAPNGVAELALAMRAPADVERVALLLSWLNDHFPYIVIEADPSLPVDGAVELVVQSDLAIVYFTASEPSLLKTHLLVDDATEAAAPKSLQLHPFVTAPNDGLDVSLKEISERIGAPVCGVLRTGRTPAFENHIRYVAHTIGRCRTGLALSSGAAKGLAHVGVIQVLEENGIEIDVVVGTSMGAYVGACWCYGFDGKHLQTLAEEIAGRSGLFQLTDPVFPPRRGFVRGRKAKARIMKSIGDVTFSDLIRPLRVVVTDLDTLQARVIDSGHVASAVHASMAMPGICVPVNMDDSWYTDGAVSDPLPVDVLERMGIERIIAVSTQPTLDDIEACRLSTGMELPRPWWRRLLGFVNRHVNYFAKGNVLDTLMRGLQGSQLRLVEASARRADVFIQVYPCDARWYQFDQHRKYIAAGRIAATAKLKELKRLQGKAGMADQERLL